ncbi:LCP family protein [Chloroflexota bacterium]
MKHRKLISFALIPLIAFGLIFGSLQKKPLVSLVKAKTNPEKVPEYSSIKLIDFPFKVVPLEGPFLTFTPKLTQQKRNDQFRPLCGNKSILNILVAGIDYWGDDYLYGLADSIRIIRVDFRTHEVSVLTLERAIWVEIPGISDHYGITHHNLNMAYLYGVPAMGYYDGQNGGAGLLAETLKLNLGIDIDNYLVVGMEAFAEGIDILGGIDVYLPQEVVGDFGEPGSEYYQTLGYFPPGLNHLDGQRTLDLSRIRMGYSTIFRNQNQDRIFKGIFQKVLSPGTILRLPELVQLWKDSVLTNITPDQIGSMICLVSRMRSSDLSFTSIPKEYYIETWNTDPALESPVDGFNVDFEFFRKYINKFLNGQIP